MIDDNAVLVSDSIILKYRRDFLYSMEQPSEAELFSQWHRYLVNQPGGSESVNEESFAEFIGMRGYDPSVETAVRDYHRHMAAKEGVDGRTVVSLMEAFAADQSDEGLVMAVDRHHTGYSKVDDDLRAHAHMIWFLMKAAEGHPKNFAKSQL